MINKYLKKYSLVAILSIGFTGCEWTLLEGTNSSDLINGMSADKKGHVITAGYTRDTAEGDIFDINVMKVTAKGDVVWSKNYNSSTHDIGYNSISDRSGNIYIAAMTKGNFGDLAATCGSDNYPDSALLKLDSNGNLLWGRLICSDKAGLARGIGLDGSDNVYIAGNNTGNLEGHVGLGGNDVFVAKFDSKGNRKFLTQIATEQSEYPYSMVVDKRGNSYIAGYTKGDLGGNNAGSDDIFISKLTSNGKVAWTKQYGTSTTDSKPSISFDSKKSKLYITGKTKGDLGSPNLGSYDIFVTAMSLNGKILWNKQFGTEETDTAEDITTLSNGNIIIAGNSNINPEEGSTHSDIHVLEISPKGALISQDIYGTNSKDYAYGIANTGYNTAYIGGYTRDSLEGQPHSGGLNDRFISHKNFNK